VLGTLPWGAIQLEVAVARSARPSADGWLAPVPISGLLDAKLAGTLLAVPLVLLLAFAILLTGAFPEPDDFGIAATWRDSGLVDTLREMYLSWSGRLPGISLSLLPFVLQEFAGMDLLLSYRICCAGALAGVVIASFWCAQLLLPDHSTRERLLLGSLFAVSIVVGAPAPEAVILRFNEAGFYAVPGLALFLTMVWLSAAAKERISPIQAGVLATVSFLVALSSEFSGIVLVLLIGGSLVQRCLIRGAPRQYQVHAALVGITVIGTLMVLLAPGNAIRLNALGIHESIVSRAISTVPSTAFDVVIFLFRRLTNPALLGAMLTLLIIASPSSQRLHSVRSAALIVCPLVTSLIVLTVGLWIGRVATGEMLVQRAQNELHFVLVASLAVTTILASRFGYGNRLIRSVISRFPFLRLRTALVALSLLMLLTPKFLAATKAMTSDFGDYSSSVAERFALIANERSVAAVMPKKDVVLPRLSHTNAFFEEPLREDPDYWTNRLVSRYIGTNSVKIEKPN
jgi:hypothetical protein